MVLGISPAGPLNHPWQTVVQCQPVRAVPAAQGQNKSFTTGVTACAEVQSESESEFAPMSRRADLAATKARMQIFLVLG